MLATIRPDAWTHLEQSRTGSQTCLVVHSKIEFKLRCQKIFKLIIKYTKRENGWLFRLHSWGVELAIVCYLHQLSSGAYRGTGGVPATGALENLPGILQWKHCLGKNAVKVLFGFYLESSKIWQWYKNVRGENSETIILDGGIRKTLGNVRKGLWNNRKPDKLHKTTNTAFGNVWAHEFKHETKGT